MFPAQTYVTRRDTLRKMIGSGIILLPGNTDMAINFPNNAGAFRQDSTFLYYFGLANARLAAIIDIDNDRDTLYGDDVTVDEMVWTGPVPALVDLAASVGVKHTAPTAALRGACRPSSPTSRVRRGLRRTRPARRSTWASA